MWKKGDKLESYLSGINMLLPMFDLKIDSNVYI